MERRIEGFIWPDWVVEKLAEKHGVEPEEAEEAFFDPLYKVRRTELGKYYCTGDPKRAAICSSSSPVKAAESRSSPRVT